MIYSLEVKETEKLLKLCGEKNVFLCKIISDTQAFLPFSLCETYVVVNEQNIPTSAFMLHNKVVTVFAHSTDIPEIAEFLKLRENFYCIEGDIGTVKRIISRAKLHCVKKKGTVYICPRGFIYKTVRDDISFSYTSDIKMFFEGMKHCEEKFAAVGYDNYLLEVVYRKKTGNTRMLLGNTDGECRATGGIFWSGDGVSLIADVAVEKTYRRHGYATALLRKLCADVFSEGKTPVLLCIDKSSLKFYNSDGFIPAGEFMCADLI